jgi:hypothetical protein
MAQALDLLLEPLHQPDGLGMAAQGEAPQRQALARVVQLQRAHTAVVKHAQAQAGGQAPGAEGRVARRARQQAAFRQRHEAGAESQVGGEVNVQAGLYVFMGRELGAKFAAQFAARGIRRGWVLHVRGNIRPDP